MRLLEMARRHALATALLAGALVGAVVGLFLPIHAAKPPVDAEQDWVLPSPTDIAGYDKADSERLRDARFWGAATDSRKSGKSTWNLLGIVLRPSSRIAVAAASGDQKPVWLGIGDKLPDGSVLVALDKEAAHLEREGCRYSRRLFASAKDKAIDPCAEAPVPAAANRAPARQPSPASGTSGQPTR